MAIDSMQQRAATDYIVEKTTFVSNANYSMTTQNSIVRVALTSTTNSVVTLPAVGECRGRIFTLVLDSVGTGQMTVQDKANDAAFTSRVLSVAGDQLVLLSTGAAWVVLEGNSLVEVGASTALTQRTEVFDDFNTYQAGFTELDHPWILNSGADAQALDPNITAAEGGVMRLVTGDADGTTANDGSQIVLAVPVQADSGGLVFETRLKIATAITTVSVFAGLTDSTALEEAFTNSADVITSTASDGCGFLYDTDATTDDWWAVAVDSDVDDTGNASTGTAPVADTYQTLRMEVSADGNTIAMYIDGVLEATLAGGGVSSDVNLYATVIACATTTTSKTVDVDYVYVGHTR